MMLQERSPYRIVKGKWTARPKKNINRETTATLSKKIPTKKATCGEDISDKWTMN